MKVGTDAAERCVGSDLLRRGLRQVRHDETVVIRAGRFDCHPAQQRMVQVRQFEPRNVGRDLKEMFEHRQRAADDHGSDNSVAERERALQSDHAPIIVHRRE